MKLFLNKKLEYIPVYSILLKALLIFILISQIGIASDASDLMAENVYGFIKSADVKQFDEVISGFHESFPDARIKIIDLDRKQDQEKVTSFISSVKPSVIICLGAGAAITTASVEKETPVIFSMVLNYKRYKQLKQKNVTGIAMEIMPATLFTQFRLLYPDLNSIGVPYHPEVSSEIIQDALKASRFINIKIVPIEIKDPDKLGSKLNSNRKKFNGLWMIADFKLYNKNTRALEELIEFSLEYKKPLLAFSEPFIKAGSFFSVSTDNRSLGSQIALISKQIVHDKISPSSIPVAPPIGTFTVINKNVAKEILGDKFDEALLFQVDKVYPSEEE